MNASRTPVAELAAWWLWPASVSITLAALTDLTGPADGGAAAIRPPAIPLAITLVVSTVVVALYGRATAGRIPAADRVTLARVGLTCALAGFVGERLLAGEPTPPGPMLTAVAGLSLGLDALDGHVARRRGHTRAGARFDMEADALLLAILSVEVAPSLGWWVVAIGGIRYVYWLGGFACPWLTGALPDSRARKGVAAVQAVALLVAASGVAPRSVSAGLCAAALLALLWSFGRDVLWLWRTREPGVPGHAIPHGGIAALKAGTGVLILAVLAQRLGGEAFTAGIAALTPAALAAALLIGLVTTLASTLRWTCVAARFGARLALGQALAAYYRSLFLNAALPAGVLGDAERALRHGVASGSPAAAARAVVVERLLGQLALWIATAAALLTPSALRSAAAGLTPVALLLMVVLVMGILAVRRPGGGRVRADLRRLLRRDTWPRLAVLSVVVLAGHVAMLAVAARAVGAREPLSVLLPLFLLALVAMSVPLNVGGFGPREGAAAWAFGAAGLGAQLGVSTAVAYGALAFVASLPGLVVWLLGRRAGLARRAPGGRSTHKSRRQRERAAA